MGGKSEKHIRKSLKSVHVKTWQLILILLPLVFIAATLLRFDHIKMMELKEAVLEADEAGNDQTIAEALSELKQFTFSHIIINVIEENGVQRLVFGTGPFYLEHQYSRDASAAIKEAEAKLASESTPSDNIYAAASNVCKAKAIANGWNWNNPNYINCMTGEISKHPSAKNPSNQLTAKIPSTELYRFNYASPLWAPTPAGFVLLACLIISVVIFIRFFIWLVLRFTLIFLKKS